MPSRMCSHYLIFVAIPFRDGTETVPYDTHYFGFAENNSGVYYIMLYDCRERHLSTFRKPSSHTNWAQEEKVGFAKQK